MSKAWHTLVLAPVLLVGASARGQFRTVTVSNPSNQPVPVAAPAPLSVNVSNPALTVSGNVVVTNSGGQPVPVTGSVAATISGQPTVVISNPAASPVVTHETPTALIFSGSPPAFTPQTLDVSAYRTIRVSVKTTNTAGAIVDIRNIDGGASFSIPLQSLTTTAGTATSVIELPGRTITLNAGNRDATAVDQLIVVGR